MNLLIQIKNRIRAIRMRFYRSTLSDNDIEVFDWYRENAKSLETFLAQIKNDVIEDKITDEEAWKMMKEKWLEMRDK